LDDILQLSPSFKRTRVREGSFLLP
jgi:hypothetical protein